MKKNIINRKQIANIFIILVSNLEGNRLFLDHTNLFWYQIVFPC